MTHEDINASQTILEGMWHRYDRIKAAFNTTQDEKRIRVYANMLVSILSAIGRENAKASKKDLVAYYAGAEYYVSHATIGVR